MISLPTWCHVGGPKWVYRDPAVCRLYNSALYTTKPLLTAVHHLVFSHKIILGFTKYFAHIPNGDWEYAMSCATMLWFKRGSFIYVCGDSIYRACRDIYRNLPGLSKKQSNLALLWAHLPLGLTVFFSFGDSNCAHRVYGIDQRQTDRQTDSDS